MKNLIYTIAFDGAEAPLHQMMAKILVSSIFRSGFTGDVLILTNSRSRIFEYRRPRLSEFSFDTSGIPHNDLSEAAQRFKFAAHKFIGTKKYEKIMFVDSDCLFMRSPDRLFRRQADLVFSEETFTRITDPVNNAYLSECEMGTLDRAAINSGIWWIRREEFKQLLADWQRIDQCPTERAKYCGDQPAFVRLILNTQLRTIPLRPDRDIGYPFMEKRRVHEMDGVTVLHFCGQPTIKKLQYMYGTYIRKFHSETVFAIGSFLDG